MLSKEEIFKNAKNYNDDYIIVPKVIEWVTI
jgi:Asp-tRNA(Asn)/Glu-tRNA(Gln) amidotransferase C subunit